VTMSVREDLTGYTDRELTLMFSNDESLYQNRHNTWVGTVEVAYHQFIFNDAQLEELKEWWDEYQEEEE